MWLCELLRPIGVFFCGVVSTLTVGSKVTLEGTGLTQARSGETGRFVITSRTGCGGKRRSGGDEYAVAVNATGATASSNDAMAAVRWGAARWNQVDP